MAVRISGVNIPNDKRVEIALTYIYGVGLTSSQKIIRQAGIDKNSRVKDLKDEEVNKLRKLIESMRVEGELRREKSANIKRLKEIKAYRGVRHAKGLPVKGQRTKTNSRTVRGNKRLTMGSGRAPSAQKT
ncbi:30S ribosomal protein S13 [Patescibacteria group bacterium]|nr:30S ribosomal protein S13 [Patescibacteria group bacterium]